MNLITEEEHRRQLGKARLAKAGTSSAAKPFIDEFRQNGWDDLAGMAEKKTRTLAEAEAAEERRKRAAREAEERRREEARRAEERIKWEREAKAEEQRMAASRRADAANAAKRFGMGIVCGGTLGSSGAIVGLIAAIFFGWAAFWVVLILATLIGFAIGMSVDPDRSYSS